MTAEETAEEAAAAAETSQSATTVEVVDTTLETAAARAIAETIEEEETIVETTDAMTAETTDVTIVVTTDAATIEEADATTERTETTTETATAEEREAPAQEDPAAAQAQRSRQEEGVPRGHRPDRGNIRVRPLATNIFQKMWVRLRRICTHLVQAAGKPLPPLGATGASCTVAWPEESLPFLATPFSACFAAPTTVPPCRTLPCL